MTIDDLDRLVREFAPVVREFVADANREALDRIKALEDGTVVSGLKSEVAALKEELQTVKTLFATRPEPDIEPMVKAYVADSLAAIPLPKDGTNGQDGKDGQSVTVEDIRPLLSAELAKAVAAIPIPKDGKDGVSPLPITVEEINELVGAECKRVIDQIPRPKDGASVTVQDLEPVISAEVQKAVAGIPPAKDGVGVVSALIDRDGHLIVTLSDGATKDVGAVVGQDADPDDVQRLVVAEVAKIPKPKDGVDGFGFDDLSVEKTGKRTVTFSFVKGDRVKEWPIVFKGMTFYEGAFVEGRAYEAGSQVQFGGHQWTAKEDTDGTVKPDEHTADGKRVWVMSVRRGRPGPIGPQGPVGPKGKDGIDWGRK